MNQQFSTKRPLDKTAVDKTSFRTNIRRWNVLSWPCTYWHYHINKRLRCISILLFISPGSDWPLGLDVWKELSLIFWMDNFLIIYLTARGRTAVLVQSTIWHQFTRILQHRSGACGSCYAGKLKSFNFKFGELWLALRHVEIYDSLS